MPSATVQSPGSCECPEATCTGTVCVDLAAPCGATHDDSYTITVKAAGTSTVLGTATTNAAGVACVAIPESPESEWPKLVDVVATKSGCKTLTWPNRSVDCGATLNLTGDAQCSTNSFAYTIQGCFNVPLPGATVTVSRTGYTASGTTDASGFVRVYGNGAGSTAGGNAYTVTISHPAGFATRVIGPLTSVTACGNVSATIALLPDADHVCCEVQKYFGSGKWSPYPIPKTLVVTDSGGSASIDGPCGGATCVMRTMPHVSDICGAIPYECSDPPPTMGGYPPTTATMATSVRYALDLGSATTPRLSQGLNIAPFGGVLFNTPPRCLGGPCSDKFYQTWICQSDCSLAASEYDMFEADSFTVHSLHPLLITFNYTVADDWGPNPAAPTTCAGGASGGPWTGAVVVSEP